MTDQELEKLMRKVLSDAIELDCMEIDELEVSFAPSHLHQNRMRTMLKDPLNWKRKRERPYWKRALRRVAVALLVISIVFGNVMAFSPMARAAVVRWVVEWYETLVVYRYSGEKISGEMPRYEITKLPEGYGETERLENSASVSVVYEDDAGGIICLDYNYMQDGGTNVYAPGDDDIIEVTIGRTKGQLFIPKDPGNMLTITWINEGTNIQFVIVADFDQMSMINLAESVQSKSK